ncbi:hypothetical protein KCP76_21340 [Salmonella enterica subsp. enterica serovar Weltevreden]|nr:hypothetical protein KCP76_21340 [Salmonella enterica subsp. enterica serovar Weltevreden]
MTNLYLYAPTGSPVFPSAALKALSIPSIPLPSILVKPIKLAATCPAGQNGATLPAVNTR